MVNLLSQDVGLLGDIALFVCYVLLSAYVVIRYIFVDGIIFAVSVARKQFDQCHFEQPLMYTIMGFIMLSVLRDSAVNQVGNIKTHLDAETNEYQCKL